MDSFIPVNNISGSFTLSEELKRAVLDNMPLDFDLLEKAYYIYRRLCDMFYYDEEYFCYSNGLSHLFNHRKKPAVDHSDINRLSMITEGEGVICTEITMLYSKFLEILNIPYQILGYGGNTNVKYDKSHIMVRFKVGEYIIDADAGHGVFNSDMSSAKIFQEINCFNPVSTLSESKKAEAANKMEQVDEYYLSIQKENEFNDALEIYKTTYAKDNTLSFEEKVEAFKNIIKVPNSPFIVMFSWVKELEDNMFGKDNSNCHVEFFINNRPTNQEKKYELAMVIIYNEDDNIYEDLLSNSYIVITEDRFEREYDMLGFYELLERKELEYTTPKRKKKFESWEDNYESKGFKRHRK